MKDVSIFLCFFFLGCSQEASDLPFSDTLCDIQSETDLNSSDVPFEGSEVSISDLKSTGSDVQVRDGRYGNDRRTAITISLSIDGFSSIEQTRPPSGEIDDFECASGIYASAELGFSTADRLYAEVLPVRMAFLNSNFAFVAGRLEASEVRGDILEEHRENGDAPRQVEEILISGMLLREAENEKFFFEFGASLAGESLGGPGVALLMSIP
ncbi:MAG: hypothetical protein AAF627_17760 [Myxococcota bacterium]